MRYYQTSPSNERNEEEGGGEPESEDERELKGKVKGLDSPWGMIWSIATATGWNFEYIVWRISWVNLQMMLADAPRYSYNKEGDSKRIESEEDIKEFLGVF